MDHPLIGKVLVEKYEINALAGVGGMAEVFKATTCGVAGFRRPIAIKRILEHLTQNQEFIDMFVEEARVNAALRHPHIVQIHDFDQDEEGSYFLVMEWVEGITLWDWRRAYSLAEKDTPWHLATAIGIEVLRALCAAHEYKNDSGNKTPVFHRDVTPQNILIGETGMAQLTDFGLARAMDRARMTKPETVKGKLSYLAPELTLGADPSEQTDIFSLGIVLWETLSGKKLFIGEGPLEILTNVKECDIPPLDLFRSDLPLSLRKAVQCALAQNPQDRFPSARAMIRALSNILRQTPVSTDSDVIAQTVRDVRTKRPLESPPETSLVIASGSDSLPLSDFKSK